MPETRAAVCPHDCPSTCALDIEVLDRSTIGAVRGADNPYTAGVICNKVSRYAERVHHPDRLLHPLLRTGPKGSGEFRRIGWDEALDRVVAGFSEATARHGSEAAWVYSSAGTMGLVHRDGVFRLRHAMRWSGRKGTICSTIATAGWTAGCGRVSGSDSREMALADVNVLWGTNPVSTQVNVMAHVTRARKERGAKLVVIDPYRTGSAAAADMHLAVRPGTDAALACAVMHCAFRDGHADRAYMAEYADEPAALEAHLLSRGPEWAAGITGLAVAEIEAFAALYNATPRAYIRCGYGFTRGRNGAASMHAVTCLPAVTGKWRHEGGGALFSNKGIYTWDKSLIEGTALRDPAVRELDMSRIASILTGDPAALLGGPGVHAMLVQSGNPASVCPDSNRVREGLGRADLFTVVHEHFMTETARYADIVLPATTFLEHDDIYQAGGHSHIQIGLRVIDPPGEARSNHDLVCALARRFGLDDPSFAMTGRELADTTLRASGYPASAELAERRWLDVQLPFRTAHFLDGFGHPDGRFRFRADWKALGDAEGRLPALPDWLPLTDGATAERPLRLVAAPGPAVPELDLHGDPDRPQARGPSSGAHLPGGRRPVRHRRRRADPPRQRSRRGRAACPPRAWPDTGHRRGGEHLARRILRRRRSWHQRADLGRARPAGGRRRVPRHRDLDASGGGRRGHPGCSVTGAAVPARAVPPRVPPVRNAEETS